MSEVTSAQLIAGTVAQIVPPNPAFSTDAVTIQNLSSFDVLVIIAGTQVNLAPYTQDLFAVPQTGTPVQLVPANNSNAPAGLPAYVVATWYGPDESPAADAGYPSTVSPPAYALGLAIAQQLLATGVPPVIVTATIYNGAVATSVDLDVGSYTEISIAVGVGGLGSGYLRYRFLDVDGNVIDDDLAEAPGVGIAARVRASAKTLRLTNTSGAGSIGVQVSGTNRQPIARADTRLNDSEGDAWAVTVGAGLVAGSNYTLTQTAAVGRAPQLSGLVFLDAGLDSTAAAGYFVVITPINGTIIRLIDTAEMVTASGTANKRGSKLIGLPRSGYSIQFRCRGTGSGGTGVTLNANLIPAEL